MGYGGVLAWVSNELAYKRRRDIEVPDIESMWLEIRASNSTFLLCVIYRAESNTDNSFWDKLQDNLDQACAYNSRIMIIGDLNADPLSTHGIKLNCLVESNNLTALIKEPTRVNSNSAKILDQIITNFPMFIKESGVRPPLISCDHNTIFVQCSFKVKRQASYIRIMWDFDNADWDKYRESIANHDWENCLSNDIETACILFTQELLALASLCIPHKSVRIRPNDKPWFNGYLRRLRRKRNRLYKLYKTDKQALSRDRYKEVQHFYHTELVRIKLEFESSKYVKLAEAGKNNPKNWWKLIKAVYKDSNISQSIPPLKVNGIYISDILLKAQTFNDFFLSVSSITEEEPELLFNERVLSEGTLTSIDISLDDVLDQILALDITKSYGSDGVSPRFLKEGGNAIALVLKSLFKLSLEHKTFPSLWKQANVTPIHKKESKEDVNNYRPVSILSTVAKLFERIIFKHIYNHFRDNQLISCFQSGFLPGHSTVTQLLEVYHQFCQTIDRNHEIRVIFLDITKAFDKVWHKGLLFKLKQCGIDGELLDWFNSYLTRRMQRVVINGQASEWGEISAGVPQGSVLGPILFLIYINDMCSNVKNCNIRLFADDTCLFTEVKDRAESVRKIEADLDRIYNWSKQWLVSFSPSKTRSLLISNRPDRHLSPPVRFNDTVVEEVLNHKYLGMIFSSDLRWNKHIDEVVIKARKRLSAMSPLKFKLNRWSLQMIYNGFVLPVMEYANVVWAGAYDSQICKLEKIHVDGMRIVSGATARSSIGRLYEELSWLSIRDRCNNAMIVMFFKMKADLTPLYLSQLLPVQANDTSYLLRNTCNIRTPFTRLETFRRSFIPSAVRLWNRLDKNVREESTINGFKFAIRSENPEVNVLYFYGQRWAAVHHARIRMGCSKLKYHLCYNLHVIDDASCPCGAVYETPYHFFFECSNYNDLRIELRRKIEEHTDYTLSIILHGDKQLSAEINMMIFDAVHNYITDSKRFCD